MQQPSLGVTRTLLGKTVVQQWTEAAGTLSRSAAEARAKNQSAGRGVFGALLGSKFRSALRSGAAASNAAIAKDVAEKRSKIADGKHEAQEVVRSLQTALALAKQDLKAASAAGRGKGDRKATQARIAADSLALLQTLKEAHAAGLLTDIEYEEKRRKLVSEL